MDIDKKQKPSAKSRIEAVLFSVGHRITVDEICKLCRIKREEALPALQELQKEYNEKQSSLMLVDDGEHWKFAVRDHLLHVVRKIVTETELTKSVLETLAVIAFKYPILQADLIKMRTNKAYDHLLELEKAGYITRQKHSRTNLIKLTEKFFRYFDLTEESLREKFKDFSSIAQAIKEKEAESEKIREEQHKRAEELKQQDEKIKNQIESLDEKDADYRIPLKTYDPEPKDFVKDRKGEHLGDLDIVDIPPEMPVKEPVKEEELQEKEPENDEETAGENTEDEDIKENEQEVPDENNPKAENEQPEEKQDAQKFRGGSKGIKLTPEMEKIVDKKVDMMLHPEKNSNSQ